MKTTWVTLTLTLALLSACASNEIVLGFDITTQAERRNIGNPSAIADALLPHYSNCGGNRNSPEYDYAYDDSSCSLYMSSIALALYDAHRYHEASDFIIGEIYGSNPSPEQYERSYLGYASNPFEFEMMHKTISVLYYSLKASNDPRAKDWVIKSFLFQDDYVRLPFVISDKEFLSDVDRLLGSNALREAEFYLKNIKNKINEAQTAISQSGDDQNQQLANFVAVEKYAYDYAVKNELSAPYLQYLEYEYTYGQRVLNGEY